MLTFYMKIVAFLPHSLISSEKDVGVVDLALTDNYASDISFLEVIQVLNCMPASFWHIVCFTTLREWENHPLLIR